MTALRLQIRIVLLFPRPRLPDHLEMPRCGDILASQVTIFQLINSQMLANCCHGLPPDSWRARLTALHPCGNPPSSSSQSAGNRMKTQLEESHQETGRK